MVPRPVTPPHGPLIPQFFAGRSVFITGATGFMGKVLIERLLWTCPEIGRLYLLMREKKDVPPEKRLVQLKSSQVFDVIRQHCPRQLDKLQIIPGDTQQPDLGMNIHSLAQLREVSIVFHSAATLKFDEALDVAVEQNVRSVMRLMDICDKLPNIDAFIHVSTAYCNAELSTVEERIYPAPAPLSRVLQLTSAAPSDLLGLITESHGRYMISPSQETQNCIVWDSNPSPVISPTKKQKKLIYISPKPNTYTFTKALAENAIEEHTNRTYPVAIFRPSIVVSSLKHPFPGWIENLNGPSGIVVASGKGLLHVFCTNNKARADLLPVDMAIDTLLAVAWETATTRNPEPKVYNCSTYDNPLTWGDFEMLMRKNIYTYPLDNVMWYPSGTSVQKQIAHKPLEFLLQTVPLHIAEYVARVLGIKTRISLITVSQRLSSMNRVLKFFSMREWHFKTDNVRALNAKLTPEDRAIYNLDPHSIDWEKHNVDFILGTRRYLLKEKDKDMEEAKKHMRKMYYIHNGVLVFTMMLLCRVALHNPYIRNVVYGLLRLLFTVVSSAYTKLVKFRS